MSVGFVEVDPASNRVTFHQVDQVGNNLARQLAWCERHQTTAWVYGDQSFRCWWEDETGHKQHITGCGPDDHEIVPGPWEAKAQAPKAEPAMMKGIWPNRPGDATRALDDDESAMEAAEAVCRGCGCWVDLDALDSEGFGPDCRVQDDGSMCG